MDVRLSPWVCGTWLHARENESRTLDCFLMPESSSCNEAGLQWEGQVAQALSRHAGHCICHRPPLLVVPPQLKLYTLWEALPQLLPTSGSLPLCGPMLFMKTAMWHLSSSICICCHIPPGHQHLVEEGLGTVISESPVPGTEQARGR